MSTVSLKARLVLPMDQSPLGGGCVTISGDRIVDVGSRPPAGAAIEDLGDVALLPGLINAHTHLEFSDLAKPLGRPGMDFVEWIRLVIARRSASAKSPAEVVAQGAQESLAAGVTTVCDITTADATAYAMATGGPDVIALLEVIGFSRARRASAFAAIGERMQASRAAAGEMPNLLSVGLSPHAPYTVHPELVDDLVQLACREGLLLAIHLAESRAELELLSSHAGAFRDLLIERSMWDAAALAPPGRPLDYLRRVAAAPRSLIIHGTHFSPEEMQWLAASRGQASLVYCPRTHAYFNRDAYRLGEFLRAGVRVVLGTDSRASNPDLSILAEARFAAGQNPEVAPRRILQMATIDAAEALGLADSVGSITPGKLANLTAVPIQASSAQSAEDAVLQADAPPRATWYRGTRL